MRACKHKLIPFVSRLFCSWYLFIAENMALNVLGCRPGTKLFSGLARYTYIVSLMSRKEIQHIIVVARWRGDYQDSGRIAWRLCSLGHYLLSLLYSDFFFSRCAPMAYAHLQESNRNKTRPYSYLKPTGP